MKPHEKGSRAEAAEALAQTVTNEWATITDVFRRATGSRDKAAFGQLARAKAEYRAALSAEEKAAPPDEGASDE